MNSISKKTKYVRTDGWRGYVTFENAVAGANDTGGWDDSPCPSSTREYEIGLAKTALRKAKIRHLTAWGRTSNVFCVNQNILVAPEDRTRAIEILQPLTKFTDLLYVDEI